MLPWIFIVKQLKPNLQELTQNQQKAVNLALNFLSDLDGLVGLHDDLIRSLVGYRNNYKQWIEDEINELADKGIDANFDEEAKKRIIKFVPKGYDNEQGYYHFANVSKILNRSQEDGDNINNFWRSMLVTIYTSWEDYYRGQFSSLKAKSRNFIRSDIFGEVKIFRSDIVHHRGVATREMRKCKVFKWFSEGDTINLSHSQVNFVVIHSYEAMRQVIRTYFDAELTVDHFSS